MTKRFGSSLEKNVPLTVGTRASGATGGTYEISLRELLATLMHKQRQRTVRSLPMPEIKAIYMKDKRVAELVSTDFDCLPKNHDFRQVALDEAEEVVSLLQGIGLLESE
jgi:hypothetical protein